MKKGIRRYQNLDGTWTELGKQRRRVTKSVKKTVKKAEKFAKENEKEITAAAISGAAITLGLVAGSVAGPAVASALIHSGVIDAGMNMVTKGLSLLGRTTASTIMRMGVTNAYRKAQSKANALKHSGRKGMHWGERNYQNPDGTWTELGKARRRKGSSSFNRYRVDYKTYQRALQSGSMTPDDFEVDIQKKLEEAMHYDAEDKRIMVGAKSNYHLANTLQAVREKAIDDTYAVYQEEIGRIVSQRERRKGRSLTDEEKQQILEGKQAELDEEIGIINNTYNSIKIKRSEETMMTDMAYVNPGGSEMNCPSCTMAYIMRRQGLDVCASDTMKGASIDTVLREYTNNGEQVYSETNLLEEYRRNNSGSTQTYSYADLLENDIKRKYVGNDVGNPHYGACMIAYTQGGSHIFPWEYDPDSGRIMFIDPQVNRNPAALLESVGARLVYEKVGTIGNLDLNIEKILDDRGCGVQNSSGRKNMNFYRI